MTASTRSPNGAQKMSETLSGAFKEGKIQESTFNTITLWLTPSFAEQQLVTYDYGVVTVGPFLKDLIQREAWQELEDRFFKINSFGTAGVRGKLTVGSAHFNRINLGIGVEAHARYIVEEHTKDSHGKDLAVVLGYDSRHGSRDQENGGPGFLVQYAASVYASHGIKVYLFDDVVPTPELSFAIRESEVINPYAGGVFTASHNPSPDNGFKPYDHHGGQVVHSTVADLAKSITDYAEVRVGDYDALLADGMVVIVGPEIDVEYVEKEIQNAIWVDEQGHFIPEKIDRSLTVVFSPLNGTSQRLVPLVLERRGFNVSQNLIMVPDQKDPDGNFTTCKNPNPEAKEALDYCIQLANESCADMLCATDPDAERIGVGIRLADAENELYKDDESVKDGYYLLSGNQQLVLLTDYIIRQLIERDGALPKRSLVGKTVVSSPLMKLMVESLQKEGHDLGIFEPHVGFKFFGEKIAKYADVALAKAQADGKCIGRSYRSLSKQERIEILSTYAYYFIFGGEESYGSLVGDFVKDKDAVTVSAMFVEVAGFWKKKSKTITQRLEEIFAEYGYSKEVTIAKKYEGATGNDVIKAIMIDFRNNPLTEVSGKKVIATVDFKYGRDDAGNIVGVRKAIDPASRTILFDDTAPTGVDVHTGYVTVADVEVPLFWHVDADVINDMAKLGEANVIMNVLEDGSKIILRPSGTEPKIKYYILALGAQDEATRGSVSDKAAVNIFFTNAKETILRRGAQSAVPIMGDAAPAEDRALIQ